MPKANSTFAISRKGSNVALKININLAKCKIWFHPRQMHLDATNKKIVSWSFGNKKFSVQSVAFEGRQEQNIGIRAIGIKGCH